MCTDSYFFDQYSRASHIGGINRIKRDIKDFNQALYHVKINLSLDEQYSNKNKSIINKTNDEIKLLPDILTKELDSFLQIYDEKFNNNLSSNQDDEKLITNIPKVSLPASLIIQLHSTWNDLVSNTNYKYKVIQIDKISHKRA